MPICSLAPSPVTAAWGRGGGGWMPAVPGVDPPEGRGALSKTLELCGARDSFKTAMSAAASLGAQSQKKMQEVISKIPRTAAYETFPGVTNFSVLCSPMSPSTPIPAALAPHTLKK